MHKLTTFINFFLISLISSTAVAENWVIVDKSLFWQTKDETYVDSDSVQIRKYDEKKFGWSDELIYYRILQDYNEETNGMNSTVWEVIADCYAGKLQFIKEINYQENMGKGKIVGQSNLEIVVFPENGLYLDKTMYFVCGSDYYEKILERLELLENPQ